MRPEQNAFASQLFAGIAPGYDRWAEIFSLLQYRHWHASLLATLNLKPGERVLDISTGTGAIAFDLAAQGCSVVGLDLSHEMLREATHRASRHANSPGTNSHVHFIEGRAEDLPFPDATFDAITFSFLLRYVADPTQPIREMARVLRSGGRVAMLEFAIPESPVTRLLWSFYVSRALPLITRPVSSGWAAVGAFLGDNIIDFYRRYPLPDLFSDWNGAYFRNVCSRRLSVGGAIIVSGEKL